MNKHAYTPEGYKKAIAANNERRKRKYETITVSVYAGELDKVKLAARMRGLSVSAYINRLIADDFYGFVPMGGHKTRQE